MVSRVHAWLRVSSSVLVLSGYLALTTVRGYPALLLILPIVLVALAPLAERIDARYKMYRNLTFALTVAFGCFIPLMWFSLGILNGVITLTIFIQAYTMLHLKQERNYYHLYLMSLFLLLAACVQAPEPAIGIVLAIFMIAAIWAFLSLRIHEEMREHAQGNLGSIVPLAGARIRQSQRAASPIDAGLILSVSILSVVAVALTVVIFVLTPGVEAGVLGRNSNTIAQTGISQTVDLRGGATIQNDPSPVMHVNFPEEPEGRYDNPAALYWRVTTLPRYARSHWERHSLDEHYEPGVPSLFPSDMRHAMNDVNPLGVERRERPGARLVRQEIYMDDVPQQGIPALDLVVKLQVQGSPRSMKVTWDGNQDFTVNLTTPGARRITYEAYSEIIQPDAAALRGAPTNYADYFTGDDLEELTHQELLPQTRELVKQLLEGKTSAYDKAETLNNWLSGEAFEYTLNVPALPESFAMDSFINEIRRGHCELFATALALMLRSEGIPTRVVSGYRGGDWSEPDNAYVVRASMSHLWVEVYFPEFGWTVFDPSPRSSLDELGSMGSFRRWISWLGLRSKMFWYQQVIGFDRTSKLEQFRDFTLGIVRWFQNLDTPTRDDKPAAPYQGLPWRILLGLAAAFVMLALLWRRGRVKRGAYRLSKDQERAVRLYWLVCRLLSDHGLRVAGRTAEELSLDAERVPGLDVAPIRKALQAYQDCRFGQRRLESRQYRNLRRAVLNALHVDGPAT